MLSFVSLVSHLCLKHVYWFRPLPQAALLALSVSFAIFWDIGYVKSLGSNDLLELKGGMRSFGHKEVEISVKTFQALHRSLPPAHHLC